MCMIDELKAEYVLLEMVVVDQLRLLEEPDLVNKATYLGKKKKTYRFFCELG